MSKKYARRSTAAGEAGHYVVQIDGVESSDDYLRLMSFLQGLPVVRGIAPARAAPGVLSLDLELLTGLPGLKRAAGNGEVLVGSDDAPATFHLR